MEKVRIGGLDWICLTTTHKKSKENWSRELMVEWNGIFDSISIPVSSIFQFQFQFHGFQFLFQFQFHGLQFQFQFRNWPQPWMQLMAWHPMHICYSTLPGFIRGCAAPGPNPYPILSDVVFSMTTTLSLSLTHFFLLFFFFVPFRTFPISDIFFLSENRTSHFYLGI